METVNWAKAKGSIGLCGLDILFTLQDGLGVFVDCLLHCSQRKRGRGYPERLASTTGICPRSGCGPHRKGAATLVEGKVPLVSAWTAGREISTETI